MSVACDERAERFARLKDERLETLQTLVRLFHQWVFSAPERRGHFYSDFLDQLSADDAQGSSDSSSAGTG